MLGIFLQVRLNSVRLPEKALLNLPGGNVIQHAMRALKEVPADVYALLTDRASAPRLEEFARREDFLIYVGPEQDVLRRYVLAARHFRTDTLVRATGDNPLVSPCLARAIVDIHYTQKADLSHFLGIPIGAGIEVVAHTALEKAADMSVDPYEREHLTTYLYRHPRDFRVVEIQADEEFLFPEAKISLDTEEDYKLISEIYNDLYEGIPLETDSIIRWLKKRRELPHVRGNKKNPHCSQ